MGLGLWLWLWLLWCGLASLDGGAAVLCRLPPQRSTRRRLARGWEPTAWCADCSLGHASLVRERDGSWELARGNALQNDAGDVRRSG